ncbi:hypothetical protein KIN20_005901 [Parelaphostrongylus tenuis]|uniref:Uncharacterized protein n=1 Tax=Parelaphostrongylus tenuis TaxID=148309 RepID=A0AAD5QFH9_PARTN|nr:hypothetical protein KIN20_005901 [Parelaphostrongylus tenuis]
MSSSFQIANESLLHDISKEFAFRAKCLPVTAFRNRSRTFTEGVVDCLRKVDAFELLRCA